MTSTESVESESADNVLDELCIEFDGQQVAVRTNVADIRDYLRRTYRAMLVEGITSGIGHLELMRVAGGIVVSGLSELDFTGSVPELYDYVRHQLLMQFIRKRNDLLWLHAGAVEKGGTSLLLVGPSGQGKSTLTTLLCEKGWSFMSDDTAPVRMESDDVLPFPISPYRRIHPGHHVKGEGLRALEKEMISLSESSIRREPAPMREIVFPAYRPRARSKLTRLAAGDAAFALLRSYTNFIDHKQAGVSRAAELARAVPAYELVYSKGEDAASLLDSSHRSA